MQDTAKKALQDFLGGRELTFSITRYEDGEWVAQCNEISGIMTGGMGYDITQIDLMIRDAILTAAGVNLEEGNAALKFVGLKPKKQKAFFNWLSSQEDNSDKEKAQYVVA